MLNGIQGFSKVMIYPWNIVQINEVESVIKSKQGCVKNITRENASNEN